MTIHHCAADACSHANDSECLRAGREQLRAAAERAERPTPAQRMRATEVVRRALAEPVAEAVTGSLVTPAAAHPLRRLGGLLLLLLVALALLLAHGCVPAAAIEQARDEAATAHGHACDATLPMEARVIGASEFFAWRAQHVDLTGDDVPGLDALGPIPPEVLALLPPPASAPGEAPHCPVYDDAMPVVELPGRGGPCGCKAGKLCHAPCTACCGGNCDCALPPSRGGR